MWCFPLAIGALATRSPNLPAVLMQALATDAAVSLLLLLLLPPWR
jgi:hypothetical protein